MLAHSRDTVDTETFIVGEGKTASNGATWAHGRAIFRPSFSKAQASNYERHFQQLAANVPTDGSSVDLRVLFSRLTLDVATEIIFGESINSQQPDAPQYTRDVNQAFEDATKGIFDRFVMGQLMFLHYEPKFTKALKILNKYTNTIIDKAFREKAVSKDNPKDVESSGGALIFLDELLKDTSDTKRIRDLLLNALLGGLDTTMALLSHPFIHLSRNPAALKRLREDIAQLGAADV